MEQLPNFGDLGEILSFGVTYLIQWWPGLVFTLYSKIVHTIIVSVKALYFFIVV